MHRCGFVPPYLLQRVAELDDENVAGCARGTLALDGLLRARRVTLPPPVESSHPFAVYSADNGTDLPGSLVRPAGAAPSGDVAADEAYVGLESSLALFREEFGRASYDDAGASVAASVHYGRDYANAFWDGAQLVFGDGDGRVFERFTKPVDVLGHEFTHAVVQHTSGFEYRGQSGALNESVSDVFATCLKQRLLGQSAAEADWLIGEGIFRPTVQGRALRSMADPGTAYDDPVLGRDPQVGSMDDYVDTTEDNGGVHLNSGIPNRAFHLFATALGGRAWEVPGRIWYGALTSGIGASADFAEFAQATIDAAGRVAPDAIPAVTDAWRTVGVLGPGAGAPEEPRQPADDTVVVIRSGGFAGLRQSGEVRLGEDPRSDEVTDLLRRVDFRAVTATRPQPDRYVYAFRLCGREVVVQEQDLTPELDRLARVVLDE
jgi:hypothetical protein